MRLLTLDPSTVALGWAVADLEGMKFDHIAGGTDEFSGDEWWHRVERLGQRVEELCSTWLPDAVAYEIPTGDHRNKTTDRRMGAVEYAVLLAASYYTDQVWGFTAGAVSKENVSKHGLYHEALFGALVGRPSTSDDECDAMALAFVAQRKYLDELYGQEEGT